MHPRPIRERNSRSSGTPTTPDPTTPATPTTTPSPTTRLPPPATRARTARPPGPPRKPRTPATPNPTTPPNAAGPCAPPSQPRRPPTSTSSSPSATLLGWSTTPAQAGRLRPPRPRGNQSPRRGRVPPSENPLVRHPHRPAGRAIAHGRARGQHPWEPPPRHPRPQQRPREHRHPDTATRNSPPDTDQAARLRHLIQALKIIFDPIAQDTCDHRSAENRYTPSRKLKDLIRARTMTCDAPGCGAQARYCDLDHTVPYPDGATVPVQPRPEMQTPPSRQAGTRLARGAARARHHPLDPPQRPHPHHHPDHLRQLTAETGRSSVRRSACRGDRRQLSPVQGRHRRLPMDVGGSSERPNARFLHLRSMNAARRQKLFRSSTPRRCHKLAKNSEQFKERHARLAGFKEDDSFARRQPKADSG